MVYGIFTAGQRTWGGPRADAGKADEKTSPEQAIESAAAQGDELNVVPETFKPTLEAVRHRIPHRAPLLPAGHLEGRFAPAEEMAGGWYRQNNDSGVLNADMTPRFTEEGLMHFRGPRRESTDSLYSTNSVYMPRRVESIFGLDDAMAYHDQQARQRPAGGAYFEAGNVQGERQVPAFINEPLPQKDGYATSVRSFDSDSSVSLHFSVPHRPTNIGTRGLDTTSPSTAYAPSRQTSQPESNHSAHRPNLTVPSMPSVAHRSTARHSQLPQSSLNRTGKSPLARKSFTHLATDYAGSASGEDIELSERAPRRHSVADDERRGRRSISIDRHGRRRLSKQRPEARAASQE